MGISSFGIEMEANVEKIAIHTFFTGIKVRCVGLSWSETVVHEP